MANQENLQPKEVEVGTAAEMDEVMRKYDRESATRIWVGKPKIVVSCIMAFFSLYCIWSTMVSKADLQVRLTAILGFVVIIGYLTYPANKDKVKPNSLPWYDILIMIVGAGAFFYYCANYMSMVREISSAAKMTAFHAAIGIIGIAVLVELCRRCVGIPILCVAGVLLIYTFFNGMQTQDNGSLVQVLYRVVYTLFYAPSGIMATPMQVCAKYITVFIIFGAFLERTGIASFFISMANSIAGSASGGPAKVAVISSALCGMVSGSSVGNTVTTGSVTIPMMKKTGYRGEFAGAVEAAASTGGQIMPPIMGAAAFLMAEYMDIRYAEVALRAILPALLYFTGIFIAVHLEARRLDLRGIPRDQLPKMRILIKSIYLLIPLVLLVGLVSTNVRTLQYSASVAIVAAIIVSIPGVLVEGRGQSEEKPLIYSGKKMGNIIFSALEAGGRGCITVAVACSIAGIVAGCITVTGLASKLVSAVVNVSRMIPYRTLGLFVALFLTMLCCIVLGMGVPTTANYCIMATTCAPILIELGIGKVPAHFFVFYFGIVADITPPVALAAYAGSAIAKSNPMKTGINATKLAIAAFIVPYIFAFDPTMLLIDAGPIQIIMIVVTSLLGLFGVATSLSGYLYRPINPLLRIVIAVGGLCMMFPGTVSDVIGLVALVGVVVFQRIGAKNNAVVG
ncbi:MAG: TRAP transporter permease [Lawsonibacter sp.]|jgi:TRAP transporter 4TM/12TM fusion protein|nr:TRAP transporter permease [Lawsonibacter sp.]